MLCGCRIFWAASAVVITRSRGSLYVVMKTSTVASAGAGAGGVRDLIRQTVIPKSSTSIRL